MSNLWISRGPVILVPGWCSTTVIQVQLVPALPRPKVSLGRARAASGRPGRSQRDQGTPEPPLVSRGMESEPAKPRSASPRSQAATPALGARGEEWPRQGTAAHFCHRGRAARGTRTRSFIEGSTF